MSCRRAFDIDLVAFLAEPRLEEFAAFREHYPRCAACAAEVRAWTELRAKLASGAGGGHPEPGLLLRYEEDAGRLPSEERLRVSTHLQRCASCRDELLALRSFDPEVLTSPAAVTASEEPRGLAALLDALRRVLWHPAFAYGVALLVTTPAFYLWVRPGAPELHEDRASLESVAKEERAPEPLAEGALRRAQRPAEAPLEQARAKASSLEKKQAPAPGAVAPAAPPAPAPGRLARPSRARNAAAVESPREPSPDALLFGAEGSFSDEVELDAPRAGQLRALGYAEEGEEAAEAQRGSAAGGRVQALSLEDLGGGLFALRVAVDPAADEVEIRVVSPDGSRELVERFDGGTSEVELRIPRSWLEPGTHRVERRQDGSSQLLFLVVP